MSSHIEEALAAILTATYGEEVRQAFHDALEEALTVKNNTEVTTNKITEIDANSTDTQYVSAKAIYDALETKLSSATGSVKTDNIDAGAVTEAKLATTLKNTLYRMNTETQNVGFANSNPKTIYLNAEINDSSTFNGQKGIIITSADNSFQLFFGKNKLLLIRHKNGETSYTAWEDVYQPFEKSSNKKTAINSSNQSSTAFFPSIKAIVDYLTANYTDTTALNTSLNSKADVTYVDNRLNTKADSSALTKNKQDDLFNENRINDFFGIKLQIEEGSLNISTGAEGTTENRTRCNFVELNVGDIITSTVSFFVLKYNSDLTFNSTVASNTTSYTIASNGYYRIMFTTGSVVTAEQSVSIDRNTSDCTIDYVDLENSRLNDFLGVGLLIEQGGLSVSDGSERSNNTRTRSEFIVLKKGDVITSSIAFYVIKYNDDYSYDDTVASNVKSYQVASAGKYRIMLLTGNVDSAVSAIHIERNSDILTLQTIDKKLNPVRLDIPLVNPSATGMNQFSYDESFDHTNPIDIYYVSETSEYCEIYTTDFNIENKKVTSSKTVIMAPDGDDSNDGVTVPVKTISKAIELNADTIFMKEGIYWLGKNIPINTVISRDVNIIGENDNVTIFFGTESAKKIVPSQTIMFTGKLYCQGITFIGGIGVRAYTGENVCAFYRCKFLYSCGLGLQFMGKTAYLVDCEASYNHSDGLNYHQYSASVKPTGIVEVNCYGKNNGNIKNRSSNGSTVHDNGCIIRLNCIYENCHGGIIADASSKSYNFGVKAFGSTNHIVGEERFNAAFYALSGTKMWIYNGIGNGCKYVLSSTSGSEILTDAIYDPAYINVDSSSSVIVLS